LSTRWRFLPRESEPSIKRIGGGSHDQLNHLRRRRLGIGEGGARVAHELSAQTGSRLVFVRVVDGGSGEGEISALAARLCELAESATEVDCGAHWLVEVGDPADRLVAVAEKEAASFIVIGSTGPRSSLLGGISADLSRRAPCLVVVVVPGADLSATNGDRRDRVGSQIGVPGSFDASETGAAAGHDAAWARSPANGERAEHDPDARAFAGGIVRFSIGGGVG
jgi:nucleotide-binding universal stress UspA family protein